MLRNNKKKALREKIVMHFPMRQLFNRKQTQKKLVSIGDYNELATTG